MSGIHEHEDELVLWGEKNGGRGRPSKGEKRKKEKREIGRKKERRGK